MDAKKLSTDELLEELRLRGIEGEIDRFKIKEITPKVIDSPNLDALKKICLMYVNDHLEKGKRLVR